MKSRRNSVRRGTLHRQLSMSMSIRKGYEISDTDRVVDQILSGDDKMETEAQATMRRRATIRQISSSMSTKRRIR